MAHRAALLIAQLGLAVVGAGCVNGLPRRVPGSDITLPESPGHAVLRGLVSRCQPADSVVTVRDPGTKCGQTAVDLMRFTSDPPPPPVQKIP